MPIEMEIMAELAEEVEAQQAQKEEKRAKAKQGYREKLTVHTFDEPDREYPKIGCPNRLFSVTRFLDSRCQSRLSSAWWRRIFKESVSSRASPLRPIEFFITS